MENESSMGYTITQIYVEKVNNMLYEFSRTELLIGKENMDRLKNSKVAIFGIGGVGSYVVEGLVRSGIGKFVLIDDDHICLTNINRQLHATRKTVGKLKVDIMKQRILEINPNAEVTTYQEFYLPSSPEEIINEDYDYIVDAVDTITAKLDLIVKAKEKGIKIISSMGAGNKIHPTMFEVADIYETSVCRLARVMRRQLRKREISSLKVVYSKELPLKPIGSEDASCAVGCICPPGTTRKCTEKHLIPGSISFVPSVVGLIIAGEVVKDLIQL